MCFEMFDGGKGSALETPELQSHPDDNNTNCTLVYASVGVCVCIDDDGASSAQMTSSLSQFAHALRNESRSRAILHNFSSGAFLLYNNTCTHTYTHALAIVT